MGCLFSLQVQLHTTLNKCEMMPLVATLCTGAAPIKGFSHLDLSSFELFSKQVMAANFVLGSFCWINFVWII